MKLSTSLTTMLAVLPALVAASSGGIYEDFHMPLLRRHFGRNPILVERQNNPEDARATAARQAQQAAARQAQAAQEAQIAAQREETRRQAAAQQAAAAAANQAANARNRNGGNNNNNNNQGNANNQNNNQNNNQANNQNNNQANNQNNQNQNNQNNQNNNNQNNQNNNQNNNNNNNNNNNGGAAADPNLTLTQDLIATNLAADGQAQPIDGQVPSLTSTNNFINFCAGKTITNGQQITTGSCDPIPMGDIVAKDKMPHSKFVFPQNFATIPANQDFTIQMALNNLQAGVFTNAQKT
ncbi:hypothetical protein FRB91_001394, partial [Serendipita sp. 411]